MEYKFTDDLNKYADDLEKLGSDANTKQIIAFRGISLYALQKINNLVQNGTLAKGIELYVATQDLNDEVKIGKTIKLETHGDGDCAFGKAPFTKKKHLVEFHPQRTAVFKPRRDWTTEDVCEYVVMPATQNWKEFPTFLDYLSSKALAEFGLDDNCIGEENQGYFVSQSRSCRFAEMVAALEDQMQNEPEEKRFYWLDIFCANQPVLTDRSTLEIPPEIDHIRWKVIIFGMHKAVLDFEASTIFIDRWDDPAPLKRSWCVWEIYGSIRYKRPMKITFAPGQAAKYIETLLDEEQDISTILAEEFDMRNSDAFGDVKEKIDAAVEEIIEGGFVTLNATINVQIREWLEEIADMAIRIAREQARQETVAELCERSGTLLRDHGAYQRALDYFKEARDIYASSETLSSCHEVEIRILNNMASVYMMLDRAPEALHIYEEARDILVEKLGPHNILLAKVHTNIGSAQTSLAQYQQALHSFERAELIEIEVEKGMSHQMAVILNNKAKAHVALEQYPKALDLALHSFEIMKENRVPRHPEVGIALCNLADICVECHRYKEALDHCAAAREILEESLGAKHPTFIRVLEVNGNVNRRLGSYQEALNAFQKARTIAVKNYGESHTEVAKQDNNIAVIYLSQGNYSLARKAFENSLRIYANTIGCDHHYARISSRGLASVYKHEKRYEKARAILEGLFKQIITKYQNNQHPEIAATLHTWADVESAAGNDEIATRFYLKALEIQKAAFGNSHPDVGSTLCSIAEMYKKMGIFEGAYDYYNQALKVRELYFGPSHRRVAITKYRIGEVHMADVERSPNSQQHQQQHLQFATRIYLDALSQQDRCSESERDYQVMGNLSFALAKIYACRGEFNKALDYSKRSIAEMTKAFENHQHNETLAEDRAGTYNNTAHLYVQMRDFSKARDCALQAQFIIKKHLGSQHPRLPQATKSIGVIYAQQGLFADALKYYNQALELSKVLFGAADKRTTAIANELEQVRSFSTR